MTATKVLSTTVGLFKTRESADKAVAALKKAGYKDDQIGMVHKDAEGKTIKTDGKGHNHAGEGVAIGAAAGAASGAAIGIGILAGVLPVIGPVLALGTIGTVLFNAVAGSAAASLAGALIGWGIPDEDAKYYEEQVKAGHYLVTVDRGDREDDVRPVFVTHGGYDRHSKPM